MSLSEKRKVLLSQLVDGELPVDKANQVLAEVLGDLSHVLGSAEAARHLDAMLRLRHTLGPWRQQEIPCAAPKGGVVPEHKPMASDTPHQALSLRERGRWLMSLATAALLGGVLVAGGVLLNNRMTGQRPDTGIGQQGVELAAAGQALTTPKEGQAVVVVTPDQRRDIARAFALHESVAGPLSWYAADDATIQVAPDESGKSLEEPIAVVLRLTRDPSSPNGATSEPKTYVIVCRNRDAATIRLPSSALAPNLRLRLVSTETGGQVDLRYALAADGADGGLDDAALVGQRHVGLGQTVLGQLAMNDRLVNIDASAWVMKDHSRQPL